MWPFKKEEKAEKTYEVVLHLKSDAGYRFAGLTADDAFEDGGLVAKLALVQRMVLEELPPRK
jgi:hypothetical protein